MLVGSQVLGGGETYTVTRGHCKNLQLKCQFARILDFQIAFSDITSLVLAD
jgi:hypothetical protein